MYAHLSQVYGCFERAGPINVSIINLLVGVCWPDSNLFFFAIWWKPTACGNVVKVYFLLHSHPHKILCAMILLINKSASPLHRSNYWELVHHWWWWCWCLRVDRNRPKSWSLKRVTISQDSQLPTDYTTPNQALVEISGCMSCYFRSRWPGSKPTHPIYLNEPLPNDGELPPPIGSIPGPRLRPSRCPACCVGACWPWPWRQQMN